MPPLPIKTKYFLCNLKQCPKPPIPYNGNVSFYNGSLNNPGNLVTQAMIYANKSNAVVAPSNWTTKIYQVTPRVIAPLGNIIFK